MRSLFSISPAFLTLGTILVVVMLYVSGTPILDLLELKTYDLRLRSRGQVRPFPAFVLAVIDEKSLATEGRWPWPRSKLAALVDMLSRDGARVIGKIDDVLGVWPLHGLCGAWGGIAAGIFGAKALGGLGGVAFGAQLAGTSLGIVVALAGGAIVYGVLKATVGLRLTQEEEFNGADLSIHKIGSTSDRDTAW